MMMIVVMMMMMVVVLITMVLLMMTMIPQLRAPSSLVPPSSLLPSSSLPPYLPPTLISHSLLPPFCFSMYFSFSMCSTRGAAYKIVKQSKLRKLLEQKEKQSTLRADNQMARSQMLLRLKTAGADIEGVLCGPCFPNPSYPMNALNTSGGL